MKRFLVVSLMLLIGVALFAQDKPVDVKKGRTYTVKALDGSGEVMLYDKATGIQEMWKVSDGVNLKVLGFKNGDASMAIVKRNGKECLVHISNFTEETVKEKSSKGLGIIPVIIILIAYFFGLNFLVAKMRKPVIEKYLQTKRKEFPWLDDKMNKIGFEKIVKSELGGTLTPIIYTGIAAFIFACIYIVNFIRNAMTGIGGWVPVPAILIILGVFFLMALSRARKYRNLRECEKCHCPFAWIKVNQESWLKSTKTTTTTTTYKNTDAIDSILGYNDSKKTKTEKWYQLNTDWECKNCGHTEHREEVVGYSPKANWAEDYKDWV